jgi:propionyl-CoA carboxylase alpha chain
MFYDPMIAKLVTYGKDRDEAIVRMQHALDEYYIRGVQHNISFLNALMVHPRFREGRLTTNFIAEEFPDGFNAEMVPKEDPAKPIVVAAMIHRSYMDRAAHLSGQVPGYGRQVNDDWAVIINGETHLVHVTPADCGYEVLYADKVYCLKTDWSLGQPLFKGTINDEAVCFQVERQGLWYQLYHRGARTDAMITTPGTAELHGYMLEKEAPDLSKFLLSPMPGLLVKVSVVEGQEVKAGEELAVIEAMKMENVLRATQDAVVAKICAQSGDSLMVDQTIIEFE